VHASGTAKVRSNDVRPLNPGFDLEQPSCLIEAADPTEATHIEQSAAAQELLPPHCVPPAGDGERPPLGAALSHRPCHRFRRPRFENA